MSSEKRATSCFLIKTEKNFALPESDELNIEFIKFLKKLGNSCDSCESFKPFDLFVLIKNYNKESGRGLEKFLQSFLNSWIKGVWKITYQSKSTLTLKKRWKNSVKEPTPTTIIVFSIQKEKE